MAPRVVRTVRKRCEKMEISTTQIIDKRASIIESRRVMTWEE